MKEWYQCMPGGARMIDDFYALLSIFDSICYLGCYLILEISIFGSRQEHDHRIT